MKISTRVELGIVALTDIAVYSADGSTVSSAEIADRQNISQKYLEQIILGLRQGGFVKGQKGSKGGYMLSRPPEKIYLSEILNALDNSILADTVDLEEVGPGELRTSVNSCLWAKMNTYLRSFAEGLTLADLINEYRENTSGENGYMYFI